MYVNWYKVAKIQQEAGMKEMLPSALLFALIAVMGGSAIQNAAKKYNIDESQIENAMANPKIMRILQEPDSNQNDLNNQNDQQIFNQPQNESKTNGYSNEIKKNIIARTLYAEGKNESQQGLMAIASVMYNRGNGSLDGIISEIQQPSQFSCWNEADSNDWTNLKQKSGKNWELSLQIAQSLMDGTFKPTGTWNHYFNPKKCSPYWGYSNKEKTTLKPHDKIGNHAFLNI